MNIANAATMASNNVRQEVMTNVQTELFKSAKDQMKTTMSTLLGSIDTPQAPASVEAHLGNRINTAA